VLSGFLHDKFRIGLVMKKEGCGHDGVTLGGDTPAARPGDFGNEAADVKALEQTRDLGALTTDVVRSCGRAEELAANVAIAKSHDGVFPSQDGGEEAHVLVGCRIEPTVSASVMADRLGQGSEGLSGLGGVRDVGQGVEIPVVGGHGHFGIAVDVGDAFGHGEPPHDQFPLSFAETPDLEGIGMVDDGLDAQYAPMLVVHFNTVSGDPMPDPDAGQPLLVVVEDLAAKVPVEFSSEEAQHILGAEAQCRVLGQFFIQELESATVLEQHVGCQFRLLGNPVIWVVFQKAGHQGVDFPCECREDAGPVLLDQGVGKALGAGEVVDGEEGVIALLIPDGMSVHFSGEPGVPVEVDLHREGKPGLDAHVHEAELAIDEIEVQTQTLAWGVHQARAPLPIGQLEAPAGFDSRENTDETGGDAVPRSDGTGSFFLPDGVGEMEVGTVSLFSHPPGVLLDPLGLLRHKGFEVLDQKPVAAHKSFHRLCPTDGQIAFEQNAIKTRDGAGDLFCMFVEESFHGALPAMVA
jgi:hypothetical protein